MLAPAVMGSSGGMGGATPAQTLNSSYFPDGYVNQATTIEPVSRRSDGCGRLAAAQLRHRRGLIFQAADCHACRAYSCTF